MNGLKVSSRLYLLAALAAVVMTALAAVNAYSMHRLTQLQQVAHHRAHDAGVAKQAAGLASGASKPGHASVGEVRASDVVSIARVKAADVPHIPLASVARSVAATARSMGIKVVE